MTTNYNQAFPDDAHGLGFELDQRWYMSGLSGPRTAGHTGYTGTSLVIDFDSRSFVDRAVQPGAPEPRAGAATTRPAGWRRRDWRWPWGSARGTGPPRGSAARSDATSATLTTRTLDLPRAASLSFDLFVDTESSDPLTLEASRDGGAGRGPRCRSGCATAGEVTTSRRWRRHERQPAVAAGDGDPRTPVRCRSAGATRPTPCTPAAGVFVDGVRVVQARRTLVLDGERHPGDAHPPGVEPGAAMRP